MRTFEPKPSERAALVVRIKQVSFTPTRFGEGYDERDVDNLLDEIVAGLADSPTARPLTPDQIRGADLRQVRFQGGYRVGEVDEFLRMVAAVVQQLH